MASGHVNRIKRPNTWLHRPTLQNVKKALANPEPSTHGTFRSWCDIKPKFAFGGKAEVGLRGRQGAFDLKPDLGSATEDDKHERPKLAIASAKPNDRAGPFSLECRGNAPGNGLRSPPKRIIVQVGIARGSRYLRMAEQPSNDRKTQATTRPKACIRVT